MALVVVGLAACAQRTRRTPDDTLVMLIDTPATTTDPRTTLNNYDSKLTHLIASGLTTIDTPTMEPEPLLAESISGTSEDVLIQAFMAGNDLLLTTAPPDWKGSLDYLGILTHLAETDPAAMKRLDESCRRVLRLKDRMGLLDGL